MSRGVAKPWVRKVVYAATFGLLLIGFFYAGYANQLLKGAVPDLHRGLIVIGFIVGVSAGSSWVGIWVAKKLVREHHQTRRR